MIVGVEDGRTVGNLVGRCDGDFDGTIVLVNVRAIIITIIIIKNDFIIS
jgi:hypothetical protein